MLVEVRGNKRIIQGRINSKYYRFFFVYEINVKKRRRRYDFSLEVTIEYKVGNLFLVSDDLSIFEKNTNDYLFEEREREKNK